MFEDLKDNRYWLAFFIAVYDLHDQELITASRAREMLGYDAMMDFREWRKTMEAVVLSRPQTFSSEEIKLAHRTMMMLDSYLGRLMHGGETRDSFTQVERREISDLKGNARQLCKSIETMSGKTGIRDGTLGPLLD